MFFLLLRIVYPLTRRGGMVAGLQHIADFYFNIEMNNRRVYNILRLLVSSLK